MITDEYLDCNICRKRGSVMDDGADCVHCGATPEDRALLEEVRKRFLTEVLCRGAVREVLK